MIDAVDLLLEALHQDVFHRLKSDAVLSGVPVLSERRSSATDGEGAVDGVEDVEAAVLSALATLNEGGDGKLGSAILIYLPDVDVENVNIGGPQFDATIRVRVVVNPLFSNDPVNGRKMSEGQLALRVLRIFHQWKPGGSGGLMVPQKRAIEPANGELPEGNNGYDVAFTIRCGLETVEKTAAPRTAVAAGQCTLTCTTADAEIFYTLDGSPPTRSNPFAALYQAPFPVAIGDRLRASASSDGAIASDTIFLRIS